MKELLHYKDYYGTIETSLKDNILYGKVVGIRGLLSYEGNTLEELKKDFRGVVDEYLDDCKERGIKPQISYKGNFNVRVTPKLHRDLVVYAEQKDESLNSVVREAIEN
ncbi:type II toxin-antitoxin system HicB family antitoxin, partial [Limosilactobacillus sp.]|uniref:type II toxin-antitoxin system HicB family antitoxin n=1 Tax=Limosilactobacillus sp. TaxID=2773925 RepID=UPI0025B9EEFE